MTESPSPGNGPQNGWHIPLYILGGVLLIALIVYNSGFGHGGMLVGMWIIGLLVIAGLVGLGYTLGRQGGR